MAKKQEINESELQVSEAENVRAVIKEKEAEESSDDNLPELNLKANIKVANSFDWNSYETGRSTVVQVDRKDLEDMYVNTLSEVNEQELVIGTVMSITNKEVVLNIGFKSDGLIPLSEFKDLPDLKVGDQVEVLLETKEDKSGQVVLSRKKAVSGRAWENIKLALENDTIVTGYVKSRTKGGLVVDVMGIDAFLPGSQIDIKPIRDYDQYVGQTMQFKVVKINEAFRNVVISHKALIEDDIEQQRSDIISKMEKGQVLEGVVKNMTSFGVFIDLGGVDGLLHITDISWGRINHPEEVLKLDQKVNVVVLDFDDEKKRISLGLKQLTPHPWESLPEDIQVDSKVKGKIVTVADYGAFLEIMPGIEGLIHVSEMSWSQHLKSPQDFFKVGDEVEAVVLTIDRAERKMSLGVKQLTTDPWAAIADKYPVGSKHTGTVRNLTNYGLFVELEEGVDGLVHVSDLSWSRKIKHPSEFIKKDEQLEVVVLEIDVENRRLSLGHKQLDENPWDTFETIFTIGSTHQGTVMKVTDKGATIALPYGVEGYCTSKNLAKADKSKAKEDEALDFVVTEFNKDAKRIVVSHTRTWKEDAEKDEVTAAPAAKKGNAKSAASNAIKKVNQSIEKDTLGDLDALAALKAQMEGKDKEQE